MGQCFVMKLNKNYIKYVIMSIVIPFMVSCQNDIDKEDELLNNIISNLNGDIINPANPDRLESTLDKLIVIDSLLDCQYLNNEFTLSSYTGKWKLDIDLDTLFFAGGLIIKDDKEKNIKVFYHDDLIYDNNSSEKYYKVNISPANVGKDSVYVIITTKGNEYANLIYFNVEK